MKPKIEFIFNKKTSCLDIRIKIYKIPPGLYSTGISVKKDLFDAEKQICGDVSVQAYMTSTKEIIERTYRPGHLPDQLWAEYKAAIRPAPTLGEAFNYYIDVMELAPATKQSIISVRMKAEEATIINCTLDSINPAMVRLFFNGIKAGKGSKKTWFTIFKSVITRYINDHNLNIRLNIDGIVASPPKKDAEEQEAEYLTFEEVKNLLAMELKDPKMIYFRDIFVIMCFTGLSVGDIIRFTPESMISADGKWIRYKRIKTIKKGRTCQIPMLPITKSLIYKYEWPTKLPKRTIQWYCKDKLTPLLGRRITPHTARHTFGGIMLFFGFSMESVREMMGHSSVAITEQIYAKVSKEKIEREMKEIPEQMNKMLTL